MIYHQRDNRRQRRKIKFYTSIVIIFILIITLLGWFAPHVFSSAIQFVSKPFLNSRDSGTASVDTVFTIFSSKQKLAQENAQLKNDLVLYNAIKAERDSYKLQNDQLQTMLNVAPKDHKVVSGRIISKPGFSPYDTVLINVGSDNGIAVNQRVLASDATVVGYIGTVTSSTASVILYSSPDQKTDVLVGPHSLQTTAEGKGGGNFEIRLPKNSGIVAGDNVSLALDPQKIIGVIGQADASPSDSFEDILFKNTVDVNRLNYLLVEIN